MRVRYQMIGEQVVAECDLTEKKARSLFNDLKTKALCEWGELVAEEEEEGGYMEVLEDFDNIRLSRVIKSIIG